MIVKFKRLNDAAKAPYKKHTNDAGYDLYATSRVFDSNGNATYGTGIAMEIPIGYVGLVFPRSSIANKDLSFSNAVGVIDSDFRGEIKVKFKPTLVFVDCIDGEQAHGISEHDYLGSDQVDLSTQEVTFHGRNKNYPDISDGCSPFKPRVYEIGERIAQIIIIPYPKIEFEESNKLSDTERGIGGYGSTGTK